MSRSSRRSPFIVLLVILVCGFLGVGFSQRNQAPAADADVRDNLKQFSEVYDLVEQNYAEPVNADKAIYNGAIPGMLHVLDPHSNFFDPKQYALFREEQEGKYYGVGMIVAQSRDSRDTVVQSPFFNSPAFKAGIRPGDIILKVDGKKCTGLTTTEVADM